MSRPRFGPRSLTARLAIAFATLGAGLLAVAGLLIERAVSGHFDELDAHELGAKVAAIGMLLERTTTTEALDTLPERLEYALAGHDTLLVVVRDDASRLVHAIRGERLEPALAPRAASPGGQRHWADGGAHFIGREVTVRIPLPEPLEVELLVALDISHHVRFLRELRARLWIGISGAALAAALLGWVAARRGLAPLRDVTAAAQRLSAERLDERLSEHHAPAEIRELVEALNGMLQRLEGAFRRLGDVSADIAHELRTPLSNLITQTEVALSRARTADAYREVLHSNREELGRLARMSADMLLLAKTDDGLPPGTAERIDLAREARALVEFYEALAEEAGVRLDVSGAASVIGNRLMLRRALSNLVSNAIRHSPAGGAVTIAIVRDPHDPQGVCMTVSNPGDPIPPEALPRLFERFHRTGRSRAPRGEGAGLGLAITRSIVEAHGGRVTVESGPGLTRFRLHLPATDSLGEIRLANGATNGDAKPTGRGTES